MVYSELAREKMWSRIHLIPLLQAEEDRDQVRRHLANQAREKELLGAETKVFNSDRCVVIELKGDGIAAGNSLVKNRGDMLTCLRDRFVRPYFAATPRESN